MTSTEVTVLPDSVFQIDRTGPVPLYFQLAQRLEEAIESGKLPAGCRLENEITLSERLSMSRPTVRRAIQALVEKGLIVRRRGIGTQVVHGTVTRQVELTSLFDDLQRTNKQPTTLLLLHEVIPADKTASASLGVPLDSPVLHLRRLRGADGVPVALLDNTLPEDFTNLTAEDLAEHGLYQLLQARGTTMRVARQRIGARKATPSEAKHLDIQRGAPVLTMDRTAFDGSGRAVEFGHHCYRPDLYSFETTLVGR